ncbi:MAG TPA: PQQ-binding-like beta-propeller repeat protein, partial [Chthoniobacteraceae bacterium]|nr:PQQ-binding-like beta-propeller repeat protein [Chthoniobacteraceae bacterium]
MALAALVMPLRATEVLSYHYDQQSTGQNLTESTLTPAAVQAFRKLWSQKVDGNVYAQPLYMEAVHITAAPHPGAHDTVFIATEHDSLYALDAKSGTLLWHTSLLTKGLPKAAKITTVPAIDTECTDLVPEIGITGTPVIDPVGGYLYVAAKSKQTIAGDTSDPRWVYTVFKVSISNGGIAASNIIAATSEENGQYQFRTDPDPGAPQDPWIGGVANDNVYINGHYRVYFNALREMNRPGALLSNGNVFFAFGSHGDNGPFHGWLLSFDAGSLGMTGVFCTTPNGSEGGIWQAGGIPALDGSGNIYFMTGNGTFDSGTNGDGTLYGLDQNGFPQMGDYGDCFLKMAVDPTTSATNQNTNGWGLQVLDYFSPMDNFNLSANDTDLGSGALVILPDEVGTPAHPHLLIGGGKAGKAYLIDRDNMGKFSPSTENVVQTQAGLIQASFSTPAYFNGNLYWTGLGNYAQMFSIGNAAFSSTASSISSDVFGYPGATPAITASGTNNGLVWMLDRDTNQLRVYDAQNLNTEYWTSAMAPKNRDALGPVVKFTVPTVADGRAFVGTANGVYAYGGPPPPAAPPISPSRLSAYAIYGDQVELTWNNRSANQIGVAVED